MNKTVGELSVRGSRVPGLVDECERAGRRGHGDGGYQSERGSLNGAELLFASKKKKR